MSTMIEHGADPATGGHSDGQTLAIDRRMRPVRVAFRWISLVLLLVMISLPFMQIILREILGRPIIGAEELARFMLICMVYVSLPHVIYAGASIRLEELIMLLPKGPLKGARAAIAIVSAAVFALGAAATLVAITKNMNTVTPTMQIPYWIFLSSAFAGFALATVESLVLLFKAATGAPLYVLFPIEEPIEETFSL